MLGDTHSVPSQYQEDGHVNKILGAGGLHCVRLFVCLYPELFERSLSNWHPECGLAGRGDPRGAGMGQ